MLDRRIPFYHTIMRCDCYTVKKPALPNGYSIVPYMQGYETDWARLEYSIEDFSSESEAEEYLKQTYLTSNRTDDILFVLNENGSVVGSCIAWNDDRNGKQINSLHWLVVDEQYQRLGLGRALSIEIMNRFYMRNHEPIYIHTQPWSWKAILLYSSLGFRLQKTDAFGTYMNQYEDVIRTLKSIMVENEVCKLIEAAQS